MASEKKEKVGVIGAGRMGLAMLKHLVTKGYEVVVYDINDKAVEAAKAAGAQTAKSPAEVGKQATFVILGVGYDDEVKDVILGKDGLLESMAPGGIIAVSATVSPETVKALDEKTRAKGIDILDAPICRGRFFADAGKLLALVGGKDEVVARGRPIYGTFSSDIAHLGDVGHGQVGKAMNNLLLWINGIALIEVGWMAQSTGIDLIKLRDALQMSSGKTQAMDDWDQISFTWALKDMQIVSGMADRAGISFPLTGAVKELVKDAKKIKATNAPAWTGRKTPLQYS
jgi:3-hydroxyisobutyrate dehydrogenase/2-hydroxy-3-oxopropionate reductase